MLQIHKHSQIVKLSYAKQKAEQERELLSKKREELMLQIHALKSPDNIKHYAKTSLSMEEIKLQQIKKITITPA